MRSLLPLLSVAAPALAGIVYNDQIDGAYDFVIAGGGLAGLVLASRLSEDTNTTVLVLEAGASGDAVKARIDIPGNAYYSSLLNTEYDWQYKTVPQTKLENRVLPWPRGKVLGGSTAVNGLYLVRPSAIEVDAWSQLLPAQSSAAAWSWASLFEAMKKSETFTEPSEKIKTAGRIQYDVTSHGRSGPLHYAYPGFIVPIVGDWTSTLEWIGIPPSPDANGGSGWGGFIATSSINPSNWTRSYSRSAYIDPLPPRANLAILPNATVTKIIWAAGTDGNGKKVAQGVEFASVRGGARRNVTARKEVILAGGAIGSPHIAMHSGFGPRDVLERIGIPVVYELPGVGTHLQDHIATEVVFRTSAETAASIRGSGVLENGTAAPFLSFINSAIAYANITDLFGDWAPTFQQQIRANMTDAINNLVNTDPRVRKGYQAVYEATTEKILMSPAGQVELLFSLTGTSQGSDTIAIQAALQHPFSHGHLFINTTDPFDPPVIDPQYLSNPGDTWMVREGLKLARKLGVTQPLNGSIIEEVSPGASVQTDAQWDAWLAGKIQTEYHPSCTMSMLPEDHAGVVDSDLRMYGTSNVRVVDSSVYPIQFAAHLMAPTYGLAEQAASIIRAQYNGVPPPASTVSTSAPGSATQTGTSPGNGGGSGSNAALPKRVETMRSVFDMDGPEAAKLCDDATLARLARTSRLSFELAIPILWGSVQGVHKILALLPGTVIGRAKKSDPPPKTPPLFLDTVDFTRFSVYASYVRTLAIYDPMDARRNIVIYYNWAFIQYLSQLRLLFPNLKTLVMNHTRGNPVYEKWIVAFASHELKAVFAPLIADPGMLPYPPSISLAAASLATTRLAHKSPSLEVLEIYPIASSAELNMVDQCATSPYSLVPDTPYQKFYGSFEGLKSLRKLSITAIALESNMFHVLAMLPCLEDLTIHSTSHRLPNFYLAPIPSGSFPSLTKLSLVDVDQANLEQAWESEPLVRKLRSLAVKWSYLGHTPLEWAKKTFLPLLRTRSPDLEEFRCESRRPGMVSEVLFSLGLADLK